MPTLCSGNTSPFIAVNGFDAMEHLFGAARDEEASEDFQRQLLDTLCLSPHRQLNGIGSIFSPDINSGCAYELTSYGSLGSPDFTRQLNSVGFPDTQHFTSSSQLPHGLSPLQLPQLPQSGVPWSQEPKWSQDVPWGPLSPRYPTLPPLQNGNSLQLEQLLQDSTELQSPGNTWLGMSAQDLAHVPAPGTPQQRQQTQQLQHDAPQQLPPLALALPQEQAGTGAAADLPKPRQVHVPPGVWLVGPEAKHIPPVVQQSGSAAAAGMHTKAGLPVQKQQKRQLRQQAGDPASRKAARVHYSSTPASGSTAAAGAASDAGPGSTADQLTAQPGNMHIASAAAAPKHKLGADAVLPGAAATGRAAPAVLDLGSLVWGKVQRFPWWPAVIVTPSADEEEPEAAAAGAAAGAGSPAGRVFVRFLGTHDTSWLEPGKVSPWTVQQGERASKTKAAAFTSALREARAYHDTGALPDVFKDALPPSAQDAWQQQQQQQPAEGRTQHKQRHKAKAAAAAGRAVDGISSSNSGRDHSSSRTSHSHPRAEPHSSSVHTRAATLLAAAAGATAGAGVDSHPDLNDSSRPKAQQAEAGTASTAAAQGKGSAPTAGLSVKRRMVLKGAAAPAPLARTRSGTGSDVRQTRSGLRLRG